MASEKSENPVQQTTVIAGIAAALAWPFYYVDKRLGVAASITAAASALYATWYVGQEKRGSNKQGFFAPKQTTFEKINEVCEDLAVGSKAVCEQVTGASASQPK
jgi:hypothetical protein